MIPILMSFTISYLNGKEIKQTYTLDLVKHEVHVPKKYLKHLTDTDGLYEIRVSTSFKEIRIFCFFDHGNVIILVNCIVKKKQKTPKTSIELALRLKIEYFKNKVNE